MAILKHEGISLDEERKFCVGVGGKSTPVFFLHTVLDR